MLSRTAIILDKLRDLIDSSHEGDRLPSEEQLAHLWDVSRPTIRSALTRLETEGYVVRRHGMGSYVSKPPATYPAIDSLLSVFEIVQRSGFIPAVTNVQIDEVAITHKIRRAMGSVAQESVKRIIRTVTANGTPAIYLIDFLPLPPHDQAIQQFDGETLSKFLLDTYGLSLAYATTAISVMGASAEVSRALAITPGAPVLHIEQTAYDDNKSAVVYSLGYYREGFVTYTVVRRMDKTP
ncbi:MAG: GntR family transcriptional regulator [Firmicutes bacterium]|jgi:GntR family transcriptional regulator|nr:GntR family transcriptional regulator [Bacillota bacterium]